jgi:hypothetical protein
MILKALSMSMKAITRPPVMRAVQSPGFDRPVALPEVSIVVDMS